MQDRWPSSPSHHRLIPVGVFSADEADLLVRTLQRVGIPNVDRTSYPPQPDKVEIWVPTTYERRAHLAFKAGPQVALRLNRGLKERLEEAGEVLEVLFDDMTAGALGDPEPPVWERISEIVSSLAEAQAAVERTGSLINRLERGPGNYPRELPLPASVYEQAIEPADE